MPCRKRTQPHGAAQVAALGPDLAPARRIPFGDEADDRFGRRAELGGRGLVDSGTARAFDAGHLHSKANAEERHLLLAGEADAGDLRSEEHTSELQSLMRISYAVFCLKKKKRRK